MLSNYLLKIANLYNIPVGNDQKLVPNFFVKGKYVIHYENLKLESVEARKIHPILEFNQSQWLEQHVEFKTQKRIKAEKMVTKMEKRCTN